MPKQGKYIKFRNFKGKIKSPFMIYAGFESIFVPEGNTKQNSNKTYLTNIKSMLLLAEVIN